MPFIRIGNNCRITRGAIILAHDYSYAVLRPVYHEMLRKAANTIIGNNVFIGMNAIILMNTTIGNNVVIGAGSVVSGNIPDNVVVGGNPAKIICTLEEYHERCKARFLESACIYYSAMYKCNHKVNEKEMNWYCALWKSDQRKDIISSLVVDGDDQAEVVHDVLQQQSIYSSFEDFILKNKLPY